MLQVAKLRCDCLKGSKDSSLADRVVNARRDHIGATKHGFEHKQDSTGCGCRIPVQLEREVTYLDAVIRPAQAQRLGPSLPA